MIRRARHGVFGALMQRRRDGGMLMIEKFASVRGTIWSEFLDLNHSSKSMVQVSLLIPKFARDTSIEVWRTSESGHLNKVRL